MSPVALTCVPPHSSIDGPASSTRTMSPYLSPKKAIAPIASASVLVVSNARAAFVAQRLGVDQPLDLGDLLVGDRLVVREVEPQPVGPDVRAGLLDVIAEHAAQRPVQQVRAGVVATDRLATLDVDRAPSPSWPAEIVALDEAHRVAAQVGQRERRVEHLGPTGVGGDRAGVADLATRLGVERRAIEEDLDADRRRPGARRARAACVSSADVAHELGDAELLDDLAIPVESVRRRPALPLRAALAR